MMAYLLRSLKIVPFLQILRIFAATYGYPEVFYSDCAPTFRLAHQIYKFELSKQDKQILENVVAEKGASWRFSPPAAPWWGGFYERVVGMVKSALRKTLGGAKLSYDEFRVVLAEVSATINNRPLHYQAKGEMLSPLTPAMLMFGFSSRLAPCVSLPAKGVVCSPKVRQRWSHVQGVLDVAKKRWASEYLSQLNLFQKSPRDNMKVPNIGDVCIFIDISRKKVDWPLAKITQVFPGRDGVIRSVLVKIGSTIYRRPVNHLIPLPIE
jgi:hypothetical protein